VEKLLASSNKTLNVDLLPLRQSIQALQISSIQLDAEKKEVEEQLRHIVQRISQRHTSCPLSQGLLKSVLCHTKKLTHYMTLKPSRSPYREDPILHTAFSEAGLRCSSEALEKAVERVRNVNQKLRAYERGFISEEGLVRRKWYRHLGVAPGEWLGEWLDALFGLWTNREMQVMGPPHFLGSQRLFYPRMRHYYSMKREGSVT